MLVEPLLHCARVGRTLLFTSRLARPVRALTKISRRAPLPLNDTRNDSDQEPPATLPSTLPTAPPPGLRSHRLDPDEPAAIDAPAGQHGSDAELHPLAPVARRPTRTGAALPVFRQGFQAIQEYVSDLASPQSPDSSHRFGAMVRLLGGLESTQVGRKVAHFVGSPDWGGALPEELEELLWQVFQVGDSLVRYGNADLVDSSNATRAINTRDYAMLLKKYLKTYGGAFDNTLTEHLPQVVQHKATAVCLQLQTRCEVNQLIFEQLIRGVGSERTFALNHTINNSASSGSNAAANASPNCAVAAQAGAASLALVPPPRNGVSFVKTMLLLGLGGGALVFKCWRPAAVRWGGGAWGVRDRRWDGGAGGAGNVGGGGGRRRHRDGRDGRDNVRPASLQRPDPAVLRGVQAFATCADEMRKAQRNAELLKHDWRLGQLRLALPAANSAAGPTFPPGYELVDASACCLDCYIQQVQDYSEPSRAQTA